ncbi:hypothetical protein MMC28_010485 [Mycoblastus sanguinarius]|nr:hypothetical protein [Mycoblastus sanguinarius]
MKDSPHSYRTRQPGKAFWTLVAIIHVTARMLFLSIYYAPKSTRQHPQWTYRQALANEFFRTSFYHMTLTKFTMPISMEPGAEKERFITINPTGDVYRGVLESLAVQPAVVGGTWYPRLFQRGDEHRTVVLHFHGGSFLWGGGRQADCGFAASTLLKHVPATALFLQYRLACDPSCTFPAAIQDAVTAYRYLLDIGIPPSSVVISGDSAGGNIALALLRYISTPDGNALPSPSAALLWSPSVDLAAQCDSDSIDLHRNNRTDYITGFTLVWGVKAYVPRTMQATDPYFSPLRRPFSTHADLDHGWWSRGAVR